MSQKLTDKQKTFCEEYMIDLNATQASLRAGYSENTAQRIGSENLSKPLIQHYIKELQEKRSEKVHLKALEVLQELKNWAYGDFTEIMELSASDIKELPKEIRRLIIGFKRTVRHFGEDGQNTEETIEVKFVDKAKAFEMLNRHIGFYEEDNKQQTPEQPAPINISYNDKKIDLSLD